MLQPCCLISHVTYGSLMQCVMARKVYSVELRATCMETVLFMGSDTCAVVHKCTNSSAQLVWPVRLIRNENFSVVFFNLSTIGLLIAS